MSQSRSWSCAKQTLRASVYSQRCHLHQLVARPREGQHYALKSVKLGKKRVFLVGTINFITLTAEVATSKFEIISVCVFILSTCLYIQLRSCGIQSGAWIRATRGEGCCRSGKSVVFPSRYNDVVLFTGL